MANVFNVPIFFVIFRETLECSVIISVLSAFLHNAIQDDNRLRRRLFIQVWVGTAVGFGICLLIGIAFCIIWYKFAKNLWGNAEHIWEGAFSLVACLIITAMGIAFLRINKMQNKWRRKLSKMMEKHAARGFVAKSQKYAMFILPFITVLREGLEATVFISGVSVVGVPATAYPLPVICGIGAGCAIGYIIYRCGNVLSIRILLIGSTCFLYLISAGLFSKAIWHFEQYEFAKLTGGDAAESGSGPGSYDVRNSVWHVNCCNPATDGGWQIFNALFGWQNSATVGSVVSYCLYWFAVMVILLVMRWRERRANRRIRALGVVSIDHSERSAGDKSPAVTEAASVL